MTPDQESMLRWFAYEHLADEELKRASSIFHDAATHIVEEIPAGRERTVALRKLLEAKDAGVRAVIEGRPGPTGPNKTCPPCAFQPKPWGGPGFPFENECVKCGKVVPYAE